MKVLISAFDPFGGEETNASLEAMKALKVPSGLELAKIQLPTVFSLSARKLLDCVKDEKPDAIVCLGQASGRACITPERVAINIRDASIPDNSGYKPCDEFIVPEVLPLFFLLFRLRQWFPLRRWQTIHLPYPTAPELLFATISCIPCCMLLKSSTRLLGVVSSMSRHVLLQIPIKAFPCCVRKAPLQPSK